MGVMKMKKETDLRIYLCDIAGSLLQGGPLELRVLDVYFKGK